MSQNALVVAEVEVRGVAVWLVVLESCEWIADSTVNATDLQKARRGTAGMGTDRRSGVRRHSLRRRGSGPRDNPHPRIGRTDTLHCFNELSYAVQSVLHFRQRLYHPHLSRVCESQNRRPSFLLSSARSGSLSTRRFQIQVRGGRSVDRRVYR